MPSYARKNLILENEVSTYLVTTRCVRKFYLCGKDEASGRDYDHRKEWMVSRIKYVVENCFFVDLLCFAIMSNHYHMVVRIRPDLAPNATDEEIIGRWWKLYPRRIKGRYFEEPPTELKMAWLADKNGMEKKRKRLASLSLFMSSINQNISRKANVEDDLKGHFWESRYHSSILLDDQAVLNACTYVDLNPVRAGAAKDIYDSVYTSLKLRVDKFRNSGEFLPSEMGNFVFCLNSSEPGKIGPIIGLEHYIELCAWKSLEHLDQNFNERKAAYFELLGKLSCREEDFDWDKIRQNRIAVGSNEKIKEFAKKRNVDLPYQKKAWSKAA